MEDSLFQTAQKQFNKLENNCSAELSEIQRKLKIAKSSDSGQETPTISRSINATNQAALIGVTGILIVIFMLIIGAYVKELDPLLRWTTLFIAPVWHAISCIMLFVGHCSLNRQRFFMRYIYMNAIGGLGMICFAFAMLCIAWKESSPTLYVFFGVIHFGLFALVGLGIYLVMHID